MGDVRSDGVISGGAISGSAIIGDIRRDGAISGGAILNGAIFGWAISGGAILAGSICLLGRAISGGDIIGRRYTGPARQIQHAKLSELFDYFGAADDEMLPAYIRCITAAVATASVVIV